MNRYYNNSDGSHRLGYITAMESAFSLGAGLYILILLGLSFLVSTSAVLAIGLAIVAFTSLGARLIR